MTCWQHRYGRLHHARLMVHSAKRKSPASHMCPRRARIRADLGNLDIIDVLLQLPEVENTQSFPHMAIEKVVGMMSSDFE